MLGVVLAGVVFTILGIVGMVGMVASSDTETIVKENSILVLDLDGSLSERVEDNPLQSLLGEEYQVYGLDDPKGKRKRKYQRYILANRNLECFFCIIGRNPKRAQGLQRKR